jgi:hypothetical protein
VLSKIAGDLPVQAPVIGFDDVFRVYKILDPCATPVRGDRNRRHYQWRKWYLMGLNWRRPAIADGAAYSAVAGCQMAVSPSMARRTI